MTTDLVDEVSMKGLHVHTTSLVEADRVDVLVRGDQPEPAPILISQLCRGYQQGCSNALALDETVSVTTSHSPSASRRVSAPSGTVPL